MLRAAPIAALLAGLVLVVPSTAQIGSGKIAYTRTGSDSAISTVNADGSGDAVIRPNALFPKWSPDGSQIAFVQLLGPSFLTNQLYVMNADGSGARPIPAAAHSQLSSQAWSPDGTRIAFASRETSSNRLEYDVYVANVSGGIPLRLTFDGDYKGAPAWSPSGTQLVYTGTRQSAPFGQQLFTVDPDGGTPAAITQKQGEAAADGLPTWSPDGRTIAFVRSGFAEGLHTRSVYVVAPDGTELHRVTDMRGDYAGEPTWSPDGTKIAFSTTANSPDSVWSEGHEIYVVAADGSHLKRLTHGAPRFLSDTEPIWSPEGEQLLFIRQRDQLYTMNADGTCVGRLGQATGHLPSWQPLPGGPPVGLKRCHAVALEASVSVTGGRAAILATVTNTGTEPVTGVEVVASPSMDVTVASAVIDVGSGSCRVVLDSVTCRISSLKKGEKARVWMETTGRRVTFERDSRVNTGLSMRLLVAASETLLDSGRGSESLTFAVKNCTTTARGGGELFGTKWKDKLCGRRGADRITPQGSRDTVHAGAGNDLVQARDGFRDVILCGPGRDRVIGDKRDFVARDCERVSR